MDYSQVIGQGEAKHRLIKMVNESRVPHALLFSGRDGCGHLPMAHAFAQHLFCNAPTNEGACNQCPSCAKVAKLVHPDLHLVFPIAKSTTIKTSDDLLAEFRSTYLDNPYLTLEGWFDSIDAGNKQPVIPVADSSEILRKLSYTSYEGSYKIMIIWQAEKMNAESANRLLKILEEPPEKTIFILITSQPDQLLATIISRVQQIPFYEASDKEISAALVKQFGVNETVAAQTALLSGGNYAEAIKLLGQSEESVSLLNDFQAFMRLSLKFDCNKAIEWIENNAPLGREYHKQFLQYGLEVFRDSLMFNYGDRNLVRLSGQEKTFLEKFAPFINQKNYEKLVEEFNSNYYYIERNANPKILFMDLVLKSNELINTK